MRDLTGFLSSTSGFSLLFFCTDFKIVFSRFEICFLSLHHWLHLPDKRIPRICFNTRLHAFQNKIARKGISIEPKRVENIWLKRSKFTKWLRFMCLFGCTMMMMIWCKCYYYRSTRFSAFLLAKVTRNISKQHERRKEEKHRSTMYKAKA
jgi:hypothetical protein